MPTGYTAKIYEGEEQSGKEFVMTCARAFGALITMRDESMDAEIPKELEVDTHYKDGLDRSTKELKEYETMTIEQAQELVDKKYLDTVEENKKNYKIHSELRNRYARTLVEVEAWQAPTPDHQGLKDYAIKQLVDSINNDCSRVEEYLKEVKKETPEHYIKTQIDSCLWNIKYYQKNWQEEINRTNERNLWIKQLRDSL